ncbi:hypothetical protein [Thioalkalivibrio sp. ALM2T]|uniref:hypothetical protein n=1 Tax=Thioalkalivibrio sp. ALM2T TaxID=1158184 RepID=UPI0003675C7B|nr:hypothetical protein [Thioalkalivibrio sp. ALM2T]
MLYDRIIKTGTINEPEGKPDPHFALASTVNWMRALRLLIEDEGIDFGNAEGFYKGEGKRRMGVRVENTVLEQLFLALHHLSALEQLRGGVTATDYARVGVLAWYYGIANAASAMTAAQAGSFQEDHSGTARQWDEQIASRNLAMAPFSWRLNSLVEKTYKPEVKAYKQGSIGKLIYRPENVAEARGAVAEYLSGSAGWYAWRAMEELKKSRQFRDLGVENFRTRAAQELRDERLKKKSLCFIHLAYRYRGKANYREALFLAYGRDTETTLADFAADMSAVLRAFLTMAGAFSKRRLGASLWSDFVKDVDTNKAFTLRAQDVWS